MKAGRELDALIAEKVMGWAFRKYGNGGGEWTLNGKKMAFGGYDGGSVPRFSTSIADAWLVVEKMSSQFFNCTISKSANVHGGNVYVLFHGYTGERIGNTYDEKADTAPLAICLAALKAVGVEVEA